MQASVDKKSKVERGIRDQIINHRLVPGSRLSEQQLAKTFGVSRGVIREVFSKLEQRGLITRAQNRSAVVTRLDLPQVLEIYALREVLEGLCARLAAENAPPGSWQDLIDLFAKKMDRCVQQQDYEAYIANLQLFRQRMVSAANSKFLSEMLDLIYDRVREIGRRIIVLPGRAEVALKEHRATLRALSKRDADASERLQRANVRSSCEYLRRYEKFVL